MQRTLTGHTGARAAEGHGAARSMSMRDILLVLFEHRALVLTIFLSTVLSTCLWLWLRSDSYETSAKVLIKFARDTADPRSSLSPDTARVAPMTRPDINTEAELIMSYALVERVVTTLGLDQPSQQTPPTAVFPRIKFEMRRAYRGIRTVADEAQILLAFKERLTLKEQAIVQVIRGLKVEPLKDSSVVKISLASPIKAGAGTVVNKLLTFYREQRLAVELNSAEVAFFREQASESRDSLQHTEAVLQELKKTHGFASLDEQIHLTVSSLAELERSSKDVAAEIEATEAKVEQLRSQMARIEPRSVISEISERRKQLDFLEERKSGLELQRQELLTHYTAEHAQVKDLAQRIQDIDNLLSAPAQTVSASKTIALNPIYQTLEQELLLALQQLDAARARHASKQQAAASYRTQLQALQTAEPTYRQLTREISAGEQLYRLQQNNSEEAKATAALNSGGITSIEIVDPAVDPILPSGIRKTYIVGGAVLVGLIMALSFAFITDALDHTVKRPEDLEDALGRPVLASIPDVGTPDWLSAQSLGAFLVAASRLDKLIPGNKARLVACIPATPGAGATWTAAGLARALGGELRKNVLIVEIGDGESRLGPMLAAGRIADHPVQIGEPNWEKAVVRVNQHCSLLPGVSFVGNLTEEQIASTVSRWHTLFPQFEYILIDVSSTVAAHERAGISRGADGIIVVAGAGETRAEVLDRLKEECQRENVAILGGVLNRRQFPIPERVYRLAS